MFGKSEQRRLLGCCGGSGCESWRGPGSGKWRLSGSGIHRLAPAEPRRRTGHTLPPLFNQCHFLVFGSCGFSRHGTTELIESQISLQMFDSNQSKDKLLRLKVGAGKVIKVSQKILFVWSLAHVRHIYRSAVTLPTMIMCQRWRLFSSLHNHVSTLGLGRASCWAFFSFLKLNLL